MFSLVLDKCELNDVGILNERDTKLNQSRCECVEYMNSGCWWYIVLILPINCLFLLLQRSVKNKTQICYKCTT